MPNRDGRSAGSASIGRGSNPQRYTWVAERRYRFENLDSGYSVEILADDAGLVLEVPDLWKALRILKYVLKLGCPSHPGISSMPEEKPSPEPEGPPVLAKPER